MKKLKTFDSSYFIAKSHFEEDGTQTLVFQPMCRYFKRIAGVGNANYIYYWQSKGLSDERINYIRISNHRITPNLDYYGTKTRVEFSGSCLKQDSVTFNHKKVVNIVSEISKSINISDYQTLENRLFGAVSLTKNADVDRYRYSGYGIVFDRHGRFSFCGTGLARNVIIFGVDMSLWTKIDNRKKDILILGKGATQGLEHTLSTEKKMFLINFAEHNKKFCLSLHYTGASSCLFLSKVWFLKPYSTHVNRNEFISVYNLLREYNGVKEEIKNPENAVEYTT